MPIVQDAELDATFASESALNEREVDIAEKERPAFWGETLPAWFRTANEYGAMSASESVKFLGQRRDPNFYVADHLPDGWETLPDEEIMALSSATNLEHLRAIETDIARAKKDKEVIERAGTGANIAAGAAAVMASPFTLIPGTAIVRGARGIKPLASTVRSAAIGTAGLAPSEAILQAADPTRTSQETVLTLAGGAVLSGLLGGAAAKLSKAEFDRLATRLEAEVAKMPSLGPSPELKAFMESADDGAPRINALLAEDSLSSARATSGEVASYASKRADILDALSYHTERAQYASRLFQWLNPSNRLINSPFTAARMTMVQQAETALELTANKQGLSYGPAAETLAKSFDKYRAASIQAIADGFKELKKSEPALGKPALTERAFRNRIARAARNSDVDPEYPAVTAAAQRMRKEVWEPIKQYAVDVGLLKPDVAAKFADSYLHRMWSKEALIAKRPEAVAKFEKWAERKLAELITDRTQRIAGAERMYEGRISDLRRQIDRALGKLAAEKEIMNIKPSAVTEYEDSLADFMGREIKETELRNYLSENNLEEVAEAVNVVNAKKPKKPMGLYEFSRKQGGLIDEDGELAHMGIKYGRGKEKLNKGQTSLMGANDAVRGAGKKITLDEFGERAYEAGYYQERPEINQILDDLRDDFSGTSDVISMRDSDEYYDFYAHNEAVARAEAFLSELPEINPKTFYKEIKEILLDRKVAAREVRDEAKATGKTMREGARRMRKKEKPLRIELKKLRAAQDATNNKLVRMNEKKISDLLARRAQRADRYQREISEVDDMTAKDMAEEVYNTLTGIGAEQAPSWVTPFLRGPLKNKLLDIADNEVEEFLENDIAVVVDSYIRKMSGDVALTSKFGRADMKDQLAKLDEEYKDLLDAAPNEKARMKLEKQHRKAKQDLEGMRDLIRGTYWKGGDPDSIWYQGSVALRDLAYMTSMGGVTLASLGDVARHTMVHGIESTFGDLLKHVNISKELSAMRYADLKDLGFLLEHVNAAQIGNIADIGNPMARGTMMTRATGYMSKQFSKLTLINHWNNLQKAVAATVTQNRVLKILNQGKDAGADNIAYLRYLGIDERHGDKILEQFKKHGAIEDGIHLSGNSKWETDTLAAREAKRVYEAAIRKEADVAIVTKGVGDAPIWSNTPLGRIMFQFTGYLMGANQRVMMRGLQQADAGVLMGMTMAVSMGMIIRAIKQKEAELSAELSGRDYKGQKFEDWTTSKWLYEGFDASGMLPVIMDVNNRYEKLGGYGVTRALGIAPATRYQNRNKLGVFLGPVAADMENYFSLATTALGPAEFNKTSLNQARTSIPGQNITGLRFLFDAAQGKISNELELDR